MPDKPFFVYFAPGATHAPHHVPKEWADKYAGQFDDGWDVQRERTFDRQKELGVIPAEAELTARHDEITAWDDMPDELKPVLARQMEVYAGFLEHTDHHVGRLIDAIEDLGVLDNTIVYYIIGDNGASAEGTMNGAFNEMANFNGMAALETPEYLLSTMDELGSPESYNHYSVGWAWAMNTPLQWTKQVASHWGGTRNGTIVHWPAGIEEGGGRSLAVHARDRPGADRAGGRRAAGADHGQRRDAVADGGHLDALHLQRAGGTRAARPAVLRDVRQPRDLPPGLERRHQAPHPVGHGESCPAAVRRRRLGAVRRQRRLQPGPQPGGASTQTCWPSCSGCGSSRRPSTTCSRSTTDGIERATPEIAGRPTLIQGNSQLFFPGMGRLSENSVVSIKNKSFSVTAEIEVPAGGARGVIIAQGGRFGGWAVHVRGWPAPVRLQRPRHSRSSPPRPSRPSRKGTTRCGWSSRTTAAVWPRGATSRSTTTVRRVGNGRVEATQPMIFSADETTDIGYESGTTVTPAYTAATSRFTGKIDWVQIDLGDDDHDHFIDPNERLRIAMARQ